MWTIRIILFGLLLALDGVGAYLHKHRNQYKRISESAVFNITLVAIGNCACYLIAILPPDGGWNARPDWMQHVSVHIGFPAIGLLLIFAGAFLAIATLKQRKVIGIQNVEEGLLTSGLYRYFRHPIYTGILWVTLGLALLVRNPDGLLMFPVILAWVIAGTVLEEKYDMRARFPEQYPQYQQSVRMFGPIWIWVVLVFLLIVLVGAGVAVG